MKANQLGRKKNFALNRSARRRGTALLLSLALTISGVFYLPAYATSPSLDGTNVPESEAFAKAETNFTDTIVGESGMIPETEPKLTDTVAKESETFSRTEPGFTNTAAEENETPTASESNTTNTPENETYSKLGAESDSESETESDSETSAASALSYQTMAMMALQRMGLSVVFGNGTVPPEKFTVEKDGQAISLPSEWTGLPSGSLYGSDGTLLSSLFPTIDGCHIVNATVHSTAIRHIGTLTAEISGRGGDFRPKTAALLFPQRKLHIH